MFEKMNLQLFAEGASTAGEGNSGEGGEAGASQAPVFKSSRKGGRTNPYANTVFGKQGQEQQTATGKATEQTAEAKADPAPTDRNAAFEELLRGEYSDLFQARLNDARKQGEDAMRGDAERFRQVSGLLEVLGRKHGITPDANGNYDLAKLNAAVNAEDDAFWEEEALRTGQEKDTLKANYRKEQQIARLTRENAALRDAELQRQGKERARQVFAGWAKEAEEAKAVYPSLNLEKELSNKAFTDLLKAGIGVKTAFEVVHKDEILHAGMRHAAQHVEEKMGAKIAAQAARPVENGGNGGPVEVKTDVTKLTRAERKEICRRVAAGHRIVF
ncbi:MAG: hypothetical protein IKT58_03125 [Oscillospiraceae bacterium]|nr:hypothetical protein [Oscillospiraceae bacterium]